MRPVFALIGVAALLVSAACAGSAGSPAPTVAAAPAGTQVVAVAGNDSLKFDPSAITVKAGQPVQLTFTNKGQTLHDWSLTEGADQPVKLEASAGQSQSGTFTITRPGSYTFICAQPGHQAAGMQGTLTVQ